MLGTPTASSACVSPLDLCCFPLNGSCHQPALPLLVHKPMPLVPEGKGFLSPTSPQTSSHPERWSPGGRVGCYLCRAPLLSNAEASATPFLLYHEPEARRTEELVQSSSARQWQSPGPVSPPKAWLVCSVLSITDSQLGVSLPGRGHSAMFRDNPGGHGRARGADGV